MDNVIGARATARAKVNDALLRWHAGESGERETLAATMGHWRALATRLHGQWRRKLPAWVDREDVAQEVLLAVPQFARRFDPARGKTILGYVEWNAWDKAEKAIHRWRGANLHGNVHRHPSRYERPWSSMHTPGMEDLAEPVMAQDPDAMARVGWDCVEAGADDRAAGVQLLSMELAAAETLPQALGIRALMESGGSIDRATEVLFESKAARIYCELASEHDAERLIARVMGTMTAAIQAA